MATPLRRTSAFISLIAAFIGTLKTDLVGATGTNSDLVLSGHVRIVNPAAAALTGIVNTVDAANGAQSIAAQPDCPRKLQVRIIDANGSISAGTLTLVGIGARGQAVTQVIPLTGGTQTVTTDDAYATLTSATIAALAGAASGDTVGIGPATALGLPAARGATGISVFKALCDDVGETVGTVDATAGTIVPTTAANGTHDYDFWFNHTVAGHSHGGVASSTVHMDRDERAITAASASNLATSVTLCKDILRAYAAHRIDTLGHVAADSTNTVASTVAGVTDLATAIVAANQLKTAFNAHRSQSGVHVNTDAGSAIAATDASDQGTLNTLLNELKTDINLHFARGMTTPSWRLFGA